MGITANKDTVRDAQDFQTGVNSKAQAYSTQTAGNTAAIGVVSTLQKYFMEVDSDTSNNFYAATKKTLKDNATRIATNGLKLIGATANNTDYSSWLDGILPKP